MKQFICGPVEMYPSTKNIRNNGFIYFRTEEYGNLVKYCLKHLAYLLGNTEENATIYLASSGTGAMEAVVENCTNKDDKCLVINGGGFGQRFCELLKYHNIYFDSVDIKWNETLTKEHLEPFENKGYTVLFVNIHETTTGQLYDKQMLSDFCKRNNMLFIVDAISSFLADDFNMKTFGVDTVIVSSQKGLCLSPGMSVISFSKKMITKIINTSKPTSIYFNFVDYLKNITRGQTPYTPTVLIMYELADMLNLIKQKGGKFVWLKDIEDKCLYFRKKAKENGLKIPTYPKSNMLTPIEFEDEIADIVIKVLREKYKLLVNPCSGNLAKRLLRVAHIGNTTLQDIDELIEKLILTTKEVRDGKYERQ